MDERFLRSEILYGEGSTEIFSRARVAVCGIGAVGSFALEALARVGIGNFLLVDFDTVEQSNINRQLCALESTIGLKKTEVMQRRVKDINPNANVEILDMFIDSYFMKKIFDWRVDVVVDAIDSIKSKSALLLECASREIPVVSSMGAARRKDPLAIRTGDIFSSKGCPLAARLRRELREGGVKSGFVDCVYSEEIPIKQSHISSGSAQEKKIIGSTPVVTGAFGLNLANLAIINILEISGFGTDKF